MPLSHWLLTRVMPSLLLAPLSPPATQLAVGLAGVAVKTVMFSGAEGPDTLPATSLTRVVMAWLLPAGKAAALTLQRPAASALTVCQSTPLA